MHTAGSIKDKKWSKKCSSDKNVAPRNIWPDYTGEDALHAQGGRCRRGLVKLLGRTTVIKTSVKVCTISKNSHGHVFKSGKGQENNL
jgi:hypothetical protein